MISRTLLTQSELQEIYSTDPFSYDFEHIISWDHPFTYPISPPDISRFSIDGLRANAISIVEDIINRVEATRPSGTPGYDNYIIQQRTKINETYTDTVSRLYAKREFLIDLRARIFGQMGLYAKNFTGEHIYAQTDRSPGKWFLILTDIHATEDEFIDLQIWTHRLLESITSAQIEIILKRCLPKLNKDLKKTHLQLLAASKERDQQAQDSNVISFSLTPSLQLSTTQGPIATYETPRSTATALLKAGRLLTALAEAAATRFFKLFAGGILYAPELGNSDLYHDSALSIPAELLLPRIPQDINDIAANYGELELPLRVHPDSGTYSLIKPPISASSINKIPVRPLVLDRVRNSYVSLPSSEFPTKLIFPIHPRDTSSTTSPLEPIPANPYTGVKLLPEFTTATPFPASTTSRSKDCIYCFPADSGLPPLYVVFSSPYPGATTRGQYSGRLYNPDESGGPIEKLDWRDATITQAGIDLARLHTSRLDPSDANEIMLNRLTKILQGSIEATDTDKRFYTHEIRELERYRRLGIADNMSPGIETGTWNNTHTATLEDYGLSSGFELLYTPEAVEADTLQSARENK
ncbi:S-type pyocin domain-containing protein [Pseudomonas sp. EMN2]|uniref:S-type pyocin domain-containing protein n=1 Tax=Pseudomonas sp. EMN2 TaxID=2615212 RepID=UPI00129A62BB|nr:S-type pyocin domain-containing protein [Pseudomonas sp. EMN2]